MAMRKGRAGSGGGLYNQRTQLAARHGQVNNDVVRDFAATVSKARSASLRPALSRYCDMFVEFDKDGNGTLDLFEVGQCLESLGRSKTRACGRGQLLHCCTAPDCVPMWLYGYAAVLWQCDRMVLWRRWLWHHIV